MLKIQKYKLIKRLTFLFILLSPIQDSVLQVYGFGVFGASLSFIPLCLILICNVFFIKNIKFNLYEVSYIAYILLILIASSFIYNDSNKIENNFIKSIKIFIIYFYFIYPIFYLNYKHSTIKFSLYLALFISSLGLLASLAIPEFFDSITLIHNNEQTNLRPRGFATESTTLSIQFVTLGLLCAFVTKNKLIKILILIFVVFSLFLIGSKGGLISLSFAFFISTFFTYKKTILFKLILLILSILFLTISYDFLFEIIMDDFNYYTSSATRITMAVTSFLILIENPLGVGVSGYLNEISANIQIAIKIIGMPLNYEEVYTYINPDSYKNISAKSFLFNGCIHFGVVFLISYLYFFYKIFKGLAKTNDNFILMILLIFSFISLSFYADSIGVYSLSIALGFVTSFINNKNNYFLKNR